MKRSAGQITIQCLRSRNLRRGFGPDLNNINVPQNPISMPMRNIMRDRVPPRRQPAVGPQEITVPSFQSHLHPIAYRLPLHGRVQFPRHALDHFSARHTQQKLIVVGFEVFAVTALQPDHVFDVVHKFDGPFGGTR
ncbi:hypothetical protein CASFOL_015118 [Castilleja foliolosa]|uniref:Uncharacterized protein n=1 Tax=Castilleja foliolosa TaxID=1961234 RepID=A0ABD3DH10_9LAMI